MTNPSRSARLVSLLLLAGGLVASGCSSPDGPDLHLAPSDEAARDAEAERLRRMQLVTGVLTFPCSLDPDNKKDELQNFFVNNGIDLTASIGKIGDSSESTCTFAINIEGDPAGWAELMEDDSSFPCGVIDTCSGPAARYVCGAHKLREMGRLRGVEVELFDSGMTVEPQTTAARAGLLLQARRLARIATEKASETIRTPNPGGCAGFGDDRAANYFVEAYHLYDEITDEAVEATLAVADAQRSLSASTSQGVSWSTSGLALSRVAAAHMLVGGDPGLRSPFESTVPGTLEEGGFCTQPELTPPVQKALRVIRQAAPHPIDLVFSPTIQVLLAEETVWQDAHGKFGNIRTRLGYLAEFPQLRDSECPSGFCTADKVASLLGLTVADFEAARTYLVEEFIAFSRSPFIALNPTSTCTAETAIVCRGGTCGGNGTCETANIHLKFAGTANRPSPIHPIYWSTLATYTSADVQTGLPSLSQANDLSTFIDAAAVEAAQLIDVLQTTTDVPNDFFRSAAKNVLGLLVDQASRRTRTRIEYCTDPSEENVFLYGFKASDEVVIVAGEDGLRCAVDGSIEGAPCTVANHVVAPANSAVESPASGAGFATVLQFPLARPTDFAHARWYAVKPKVPGASGPGDFEPIAGAPYNVDVECRQVSIVPDAGERAADALRPDRSWCTRSAVECDGTAFDSALPLENELSDDGDDVESSWRRYLSLARQSADEADELGRQYIDNALAVDVRTEELSLRELAKRERVEAELEQIQDICGTEIDTDALLAFLGGELQEMTAPAGQTDPKYVCHPGVNHCRLDTNFIVDNPQPYNPDMDRLRECVGADNDLKFVTMGTRPLCFSEDPTTTELCRGKMPDDCPEPMVGSACPSGMTPTDGELGYFDTGNNSPPATAETRNICKYLREARGGSTFHFGNVVGNSFFNAPHMARLASRIGWEPRFGGYSAITVDGVPRYTTGDYWATGDINQGAEGSWPCTQIPEPLRAEVCPTQHGDSLLCSAYDCNTRQGRADVNDRLMRAVIALKATTNQDYRNVKVPFYRAKNFLGLLKTTVVERPHPEAAGLFVITTSYNKDPSRVGGTGVGDHLFDIYQMPSESTTRPAWMTPDNQSWPVDIGTSTFAVGAFMAAPPLAGRGGLWFAGMNNIPVKHRPASDPTFEFFRNMLKDPGLQAPAGLHAIPLVGGGGHNHNIGGNHPFEYDSRALFDALELACDVGNTGPACDPYQIPLISANDLGAISKYVRCVGSSILRRGAMAILRDVPKRAVDALRKESVSGAYPALGGQLGEEVAILRGKLVNISSLTGTVESQLGYLADDVDTLQTDLARADIAAELANLRVRIEQVVANAACAAKEAAVVTSWLTTIASAGGGGGGSGALGFFTAGADAVTTCGTTAEIVDLLDEIARAGTEDAALAGEQAVIRFRGSLRTRAEALAGLSTKLSDALESVDVSLTKIDGLRRKARRTVDRALFISSEQAERQEEISTAMKGRRDLALNRYKQARKSAVLMAFLARRAIEQRLGLRLSEIRQDFPLVDAPAQWADTVCSSSGVDYEKLATDGAASFGDAFVGDYVTKLENFIESYRLTVGFHEGTDTAVISMRDDIQNVRADCPVPSGNLLYHSGALAETQATTGNVQGWRLDKCLVDAAGELKPNCISPMPLDEAPFEQLLPQWGNARAFELQFGNNGLDCTSSTCGYKSRAAYGDNGSSALAQTLTLPRGTYLLSWYEDVGGGPAYPDPIRIRFETDGTEITIPVTPTPETADNEELLWKRWYGTFSVGSEQAVTMRLVQSLDSPGTRRVGAFMLENVSDVPSSEALEPHVYVDTEDTTDRILPVCEDTEGQEFRTRHWEYRCLRLCADGFSSNCGPSAESHCFWETSFNLSQWAIERGEVLNLSGFARGNFNYRLESIGLNFVGTNTRDCSDSTTPSTCFGGGFIPYSVAHLGPYSVRNHEGADIPLQLFEGNIEHARGLASERYLTNPLSESDRGLIGQYLRNELQGRPLDGSYVVRVWDEPGVSFDAIDDVQVVLNYRYWTRFD